MPHATTSAPSSQTVKKRGKSQPDYKTENLKEAVNIILHIDQK